MCMAEEASVKRRRSRGLSEKDTLRRAPLGYIRLDRSVASLERGGLVEVLVVVEEVVEFDSFLWSKTETTPS